MEAFLRLKDYVFKTNENIRLGTLLVPLYDILFYVFASLSILRYILFLTSTLHQFNDPEILSLFSTLSPEGVDKLYSVFGGGILKLTGYFLLLIILLIFLWSLSRYFIWQNITQKKFSLKCMFKLMLINALWVLVMSIPIIILLMPFYHYVTLQGDSGTGMPLTLYVIKIILIIVIFMISYLTDIMHLLFIQAGNGFKSMIFAFKVGILQAYPLLLGYVLVSGILSGLNSLLDKMGRIGVISQFILIFGLLTWIKVFFNRNIKLHKKS